MNWRRHGVRDDKGEPAKLGDVVEKALAAVGITSERVEKWLGRPCKCKERKRKLNALSDWARKVITGEAPNPDEAKKEFDGMVPEDK